MSQKRQPDFLEPVRPSQQFRERTECKKECVELLNELGRERLPEAQFKLLLELKDKQIQKAIDDNDISAVITATQEKNCAIFWETKCVPEYQKMIGGYRGQQDSARIKAEVAEKKAVVERSAKVSPRQEFSNLPGVAVEPDSFRRARLRAEREERKTKDKFSVDRR